MKREIAILEDCKAYIESIINNTLYGDSDNSAQDLLNHVEETLQRLKNKP